AARRPAVTAAPVLSTERLVLRPRQPADIEAVFAAAADPDLVRWLPSWAGATMDDIVEHVNRPDRPNGVDWAITVGGNFAGECWLARIDELNGSAAAGYWLAPEARGSRYAAEALAALAAWGFAELGLERIELHAAEGNIASQRTALRAGFRREGRQRRAARCGGETVDLLEFARLRDDAAGPAPRLLPDVDTLTDGAVVLRPIRAADADAWHAERTDPESLRWTPVPRPADLATSRRRTAGAQAAWLAGVEAAFACSTAGSTPDR
ncbi:MAG: GNAT family N-acetyltransferase, partial [Actinomycetota bacterium]|nr:GNAT family N-acetyltransferase [Actinomycetota bacterium]